MRRSRARSPAGTRRARSPGPSVAPTRRSPVRSAAAAGAPLSGPRRRPRGLAPLAAATTDEARALSRASPGGRKAPRRRPLPRADRGLAPACYPDNEAMQVSHETIYRALYVQARGTLRRELTRHLRRGRSRRYARSQSSRRQGQGKLTDMVMISERPPEVEDRAVPGHWEGDLLMGNRQSASAIATLVERQPATASSSPCPRGRRRGGLRGAQAEHHHPAGPASPLAHLDQGSEMSEHRRFSVESGVEVYFCDPGSPWQRGLNENTNGLLRQYFPKGKASPGWARSASTRSPRSSTAARARHSALQPRRRSSPSCSTASSRPTPSADLASAYGLRSTALGTRWEYARRQGWCSDRLRSQCKAVLPPSATRSSPCYLSSSRSSGGSPRWGPRRLAAESMCQICAEPRPLNWRRRPRGDATAADDSGRYNPNALSAYIAPTTASASSRPLVRCAAQVLSPVLVDGVEQRVDVR